MIKYYKRKFSNISNIRYYKCTDDKQFYIFDAKNNWILIYNNTTVIELQPEYIEISEAELMLELL